MNIKVFKDRIRFSTSTAEITRRRTFNRIQSMSDAIETEFPEVGRPEQIRLKHMFFLKNAWFDNAGLSDSTTQDYIRSMRVMIEALGRERHWLGPLKLIKAPNHGGRPTASRVTRSKSQLKRSGFR